MDTNHDSPPDPSLSLHNTRVVGASTAGLRALLTQITALYLRTPAKLFRPLRIDYLAAARLAAHDRLQGPYSFFTHSLVGILAHAVRRFGWQYIPNQVLPPLLLNSATGAILYTTYLAMVPELPLFADTFRAGFVAGAVQLLAAAPIDAIAARQQAGEVLHGVRTPYWHYGMAKLREIGFVGVFAGYGVLFVKELLGFGAFFATFEMVKTKGFERSARAVETFHWLRTGESPDELKSVRQRHRVLQTTCVLVAGALAAFALMAVQYPITRFHNLHLKRLEVVDAGVALAAVKPAPRAVPKKRKRTLATVTLLKGTRVGMRVTHTVHTLRHTVLTRVHETIHTVSQVRIHNHTLGALAFAAYTGAVRAVYLFARWAARTAYRVVHPRFKVYYQGYLDTLIAAEHLRARTGASWLLWAYRGFARNAVATIPVTSVVLLVFDILRNRLAEEIEGM